jgi:acyl CoA:acetate/3-ketoacid CoA transferase beta subunit
MSNEPRQRIVSRAAQKIADGMVVNLGVGLPTFLADTSLGHGDGLLHSENGLLGIDPHPPVRRLIQI